MAIWLVAYVGGVPRLAAIELIFPALSNHPIPLVAILVPFDGVAHVY